jgi:hypothetical protein
MNRFIFCCCLLFLAVGPVTARLSGTTAAFIKTPSSSSGAPIIESYTAKMSEDHTTGSELTHLLASYGFLIDLRSYVERQPSLVYTRDTDGWTMLHEAAAGGHIAVVDYLLSKGANLDAETYMGATALDLAEEKIGPDSPIVHYLLSQGSVPNNLDVQTNATMSWLRGEAPRSIDKPLVARHHL